MRRVDLKLRPDYPFEIPVHEGYQIYSSLLGLMKESDPTVSQRVHDSRVTSISLGALRGPFRSTGRPHHREVIPHELYHLRIGITDPHDDEIFRHLVLPLLTEQKELPLYRGAFTIEQVEDQMVSIDDLVQQTRGYRRPHMNFNFLTPTCIQYRNSRVTEMYPHRIAVFHSVLSKWNQISPDELRIGVSRDDFGRHLIEKPDLRRLATYSVQVNRVKDPKRGHPRPIFKQGFAGRCTYSFTSKAPEGFRNATLLLAKFAEYSGVGSSVARGCGQVDVTIQDGVNEE
ncbi:MAG: CRISPR system precrRNA processing endoribonuclease RAMP protein Cas6 [Candidatus Cloacimonetes bacterium]|nr:CRISPR system precrRNA processing endoribonuclease RAMP protein Cas6 [Candidatus Cloacimonadota bacterium]